MIEMDVLFSFDTYNQVKYDYEFKGGCKFIYVLAEYI